ncbi:MAG: cell envelope integrity protein TolA [Gammaproteobacteria bacterium]
MWQALRKDPGSLVGAVLIHGLLLGLLVVSLQHVARIQPAGTVGPKVIQAVAVDSATVNREVERLQKADKAKAAQRQRLEAEARALKKQRDAEARRVEALKQQRAAEERQRKADAAKLKIQQQAEAQRLAKLKQQALELQKKKEQEQQRLAQLQAQRKKQEAEKQRAAAEARKRQQAAEKALQAQVAAEQHQVQAAQARQVQSTVDHYVQIIQNQVERNWLRPPGSASGLSCTVEVQLIPSGDVVGVRIAQSSGDPVFDRSVETAVRKASPLPLPPDSTLFNQFRDLTFVFSPEQQGAAP